MITLFGYHILSKKELEDIKIKSMMKELNTKLNLILDHLKLEYKPEKETKEPAKLVEKYDFVVNGIGIMGGAEGYMSDEKPKKKQGGGQYTRAERQEQPLHCGYKSCQFSTHYPSKLKMHRTKVHRKK